MSTAGKQLLIGIAEAGVMHATPAEFDLNSRFRMVKESGIFDYFDKTPLVTELALYRAAVAKYDLPMTAGGFYYVLGRDEPLLEWHLRLGKEFGARVHNVQVLSHDINGLPVSNAAVADLFLRAAEIGDITGVTPCFEVHVNMWSEHFGRVAEVADLVARRGVAFNMTLDHSHVIFKIDNPAEQKIQHMDVDIEAGRLELNPLVPGNVCRRWIDAGYVRHAHARPAVANGPKNIWMKAANGEFGRGIQYPFLAPHKGQWHSTWSDEALQPWRQVLRDLLHHHASKPGARLLTISTEFIPYADYGGGARYSLFEHSVACATWIRAEWNSICHKVQPSRLI